MKDFTWKVFYMTGNIDTYLILKEMESEEDPEFEEDFEGPMEYESPMS